jgi:hypothetical protein
MIVVSQQYDSYQSTVATMQQNDINRFSENLQGLSVPGILSGGAVPCPTSTQCNSYFIYVNNLGIGAQIARIYIFTNVTASSPGGLVTCNPAPCILNPASSAIEYSFAASSRYINPGETLHAIVFYLPTQIALTWQGQTTGSQSITMVTTRGRVFSFIYPGPQESQGAGPEGGTGLQIGPLVITYQKTLVTYTISSVRGTPPGSSNPGLPIGGTHGYWIVPSGTVVIWVKIQTDWWAKSDVYLTAQSVLTLALFNSPGSVNYFFIVAPPKYPDPAGPLCQNYFQNPAAGGNSTVDCSSSYAGGNDGDPGSLVQYKACPITPSQYYANPAPPGATSPNGVGQPPGCSSYGYRYRIPRPTALEAANQQRGPAVYVAFAAKAASGNGPQTIQGSWNGNSVTTFLGLEYVYDNTSNSGAYAYVYGVTLPFISMCIDSCST